MTPRNPSNADLLKEIKAVRNAIALIDGRVMVVESWKHDQELIKEYERTKKEEQRDSEEDDLRKTALKTLKDLAPIITVLGMLAYAFLQSRGKL